MRRQMEAEERMRKLEEANLNDEELAMQRELLREQLAVPLSYLNFSPLLLVLSLLPSLRDRSCDRKKSDLLQKNVKERSRNKRRNYA